MTTSTPEPYKYLPINDTDDIRLIVLQPSADKAAPLHCSIIHTTLSHSRDEIYEHYTALSYVWGDASNTTFISVDGCHLQVTKNLECALQYLRDDRRVLRVWADGMCINQQDNTEKGKQVQQMGKVYEVAHHTVIFLGECDATTEAALTKMLRYFEQGVLHPNPDEGVAILKKVLARSWFYRIWILQELVLSPDPRLQLGSIRFPWRTLPCLEGLFPDNAARYKASDDLGPNFCFSHATKGKLGDVSTSLKGAFEVVNHMNNAKCDFDKSKVEARYKTSGKSEIHTELYPPYYKTTTKMPKTNDQLLSVMEARRGYAASDSRDRVFAHLGFAEYLNLTPDYGMTCQQVFKTFTERHISVTDSIDIFSYIEDIEPGQRMQGLSSWVPDWTHRHENTRYRVLTSRDIGYWSGSQASYKALYGNGRYGSRSNFDMDNFQNGSFTSKLTFCGSIKKLGRVLDTSSYKTTSTTPRRKETHAWIRDQSGFELEPGITLEHTIHTSGNFVAFAKKELNRVREEDGCFLDGRRFAIFLSPVSNGHRPYEAALVPASARKGDFIYYSEWSSFALVLRPAGSKHGLIDRGSRPVHMIGVCLTEHFLSPGYVKNIKHTKNIMRWKSLLENKTTGEDEEDDESDEGDEDNEDDKDDEDNKYDQLEEHSNEDLDVEDSESEDEIEKVEVEDEDEDEEWWDEKKTVIELVTIL